MLVGIVQIDLPEARHILAQLLVREESARMVALDIALEYGLGSGASRVFPADYDRGGGLLAGPVAQETIHISNDLVGRLNTLIAKAQRCS